jgi:hypothetical protein
MFFYQKLETILSGNSVTKSRAPSQSTSQILPDHQLIYNDNFEEKIARA